MWETQQREANSAEQDELAAVKQQLLHAQRMTALGELVSTTTHEFNNLLMTILNYAKLGMRHQDQETRDKAFSKILQASERAAKVTHSILGLARNRSAAPAPTDLALLVQDAMLLLERELNKYRIRVEMRLESVPPVLAVGNQIQQVLLNLLINARQAMPSGGELWITLRHEPQGQTVDLTVRDTGCGMESTLLQKIFQPHFSTKAGPDETGKGGSGLGLSACKDIIKAHQGRIRVESSPGRGTAVTIRLPTAPPAAR